MSVFSVLKYQLSWPVKEEELAALPESIFEEFKRAGGFNVNHTPKSISQGFHLFPKDEEPLKDLRLLKDLLAKYEE